MYLNPLERGLLRVSLLFDSSILCWLPLRFLIVSAAANEGTAYRFEFKVDAARYQIQKCLRLILHFRSFPHLRKASGTGIQRKEKGRRGEGSLFCFDSITSGYQVGGIRPPSFLGTGWDVSAADKALMAGGTFVRD